MTTGNPAGDQVEGNVAEIDLDNKYFILEDRTGKPFVKIYWKAAHEDKMRKQKVGYYEAPLVTLEENTGGMQEAILVDLPFKDRGDFPRMQKKGGFGGKSYTPRNEKIVAYECCYKEACETARHVSMVCQTEGEDPAMLYNRLMDMALARALKDGAELCKAGGA